MQLALDVDVNMSLAEAGDTRPLAEVLPLLRRGGVRAVSPNGVLGDPRGASRAEGLALLDRLTHDLVNSFDREWSYGAASGRDLATTGADK
jgi:creatinine amidohydrolase